MRKVTAIVTLPFLIDAFFEGTDFKATHLKLKS